MWTGGQEGRQDSVGRNANDCWKMGYADFWDSQVGSSLKQGSNFKIILRISFLILFSLFLCLSAII